MNPTGRVPLPGLVALTGLVLVLAACGKSVRETRDGPPDEVPDGPPGQEYALDLTQPEPRPEPLAGYGNHSPYEVLGKTYHVLETSSGYSETGYASWYGSKFHGRATSSGEPYDMFRISAAHRTLPLPTYVRVTNLENDREITVRINDRGPFHSDRIIDLSYAAAVKLDLADAGTAKVRVEAIDTGSENSQRQIVSTPHSLPVLLQVGAYGDQDRAREIRERLERNGLGPVHVEASGRGSSRLWRVRLGPVNDSGQARDYFERILDLGLDRPVFVYAN